MGSSDRPYPRECSGRACRQSDPGQSLGYRARWTVMIRDARRERRRSWQMPDVNITPSENGPYLVSGPVHLTDVDGREIPHPDQMALCRCGHSNNKPFCDGTHLTIDFDGTLKN